MSDRGQHFRSRRGKNAKNAKNGTDESSNPDTNGRPHGDNATSHKNRKVLADYIYTVGSGKQSGDFDLITDYIISHVKSTLGHDVSNALQQKKPTVFTEPEMEEMPDDLEKAKIAAFNRRADMKFKSDYDRYTERKEKYEFDFAKAAGILEMQCSTAMKAKLKARTDYKTIQNDPIKLLAAIEQHSLAFEENQFEHLTVIEAHANFLNLRQRQDESLLAYTARFKAARNQVTVSNGGPLKLDKIAEALPDFTKDAKATYKQCFDQFVATLYMRNSDPSKYGSLMKGLATQHAYGNTQYPTTLTKAIGVLEAHVWDADYADKKNQQRKHPPPDLDAKPKDTPPPDDSIPELSFSQFPTEDICFCCGEKGHRVPKCPKKDTLPKAEWAITKNPELHQHLLALASDLAPDPVLFAQVADPSTLSSFWKT
jgi:hypothetical protein